MLYFPYIYGKQYDLFALSSVTISRANVIPIIDPVRQTTRLNNTLDGFVEKNTPFAIVVNSNETDDCRNCNELGSVSQSLQSLFEEYAEYDNWYVAILIQQNTSLQFIDYCLQKFSKIILIHLYEHTNPNIFDITSASNVHFNLLSINRISQSYIDRIAKGCVYFYDFMNKRESNKEYIPVNESYFIGMDKIKTPFVGFADYTINGGKYSEKGSLPFNVVIHHTYFKHTKNFFIKHFSSNNVSDILDNTDPARKFLSALTKYKQDITQNPPVPHTTGTVEMMNLSSYPGLGKAKQYQIMNHIETISYHI